MPDSASRPAAAPRVLRALSQRGVLGPLLALLAAVAVFVATLSLIARLQESRAAPPPPAKVAKA